MYLFFKKIRPKKKKAVSNPRKASARGAFPLSLLPISEKGGRTVKICSFLGLPPEVRARLRALGLFEGGRAKLLQRKPDGRAILFFRGTRMALDGELSAHIEVIALD